MICIHKGVLLPARSALRCTSCFPYVQHSCEFPAGLRRSLRTGFPCRISRACRESAGSCAPRARLPLPRPRFHFLFRGRRGRRQRRQGESARLRTTRYSAPVPRTPLGERAAGLQKSNLRAPAGEARGCGAEGSEARGNAGPGVVAGPGPGPESAGRAAGSAACGSRSGPSGPGEGRGRRAGTPTPRALGPPTYWKAGASSVLRLAAGFLPNSKSIRLPSRAKWRGGAGWTRVWPRGVPWG